MLRHNKLCIMFLNVCAQREGDTFPETASVDKGSLNVEMPHLAQKNTTDSSNFFDRWFSNLPSRVLVLMQALTMPTQSALSAVTSGHPDCQTGTTTEVPHCHCQQFPKADATSRRPCSLTRAGDASGWPLERVSWLGKTCGPLLSATCARAT